MRPGEQANDGCEHDFGDLLEDALEQRVLQQWLDRHRAVQKNEVAHLIQTVEEVDDWAGL